MNKKKDIRISNSEKSIKKAFIQLLDKVGFSKINVQKIVDIAEINRSTFYAHYLDKYDLLEKIEDELLTGIINIAKSAPVEMILSHNLKEKTFLIYLGEMLTYIKENGELFILLMGPKGDPSFHIKFNNTVKTVWNEYNITDKFLIPPNYILAAMVGMTTNLISEWVQSEFSETPKEFAEIVMKLLISSYNNTLKT